MQTPVLAIAFKLLPALLTAAPFTEANSDRDTPCGGFACHHIPSLIGCQGSWHRQIDALFNDAGLGAGDLGLQLGDLGPLSPGTFWSVPVSSVSERSPASKGLREHSGPLREVRCTTQHGVDHSTTPCGSWHQGQPSRSSERTYWSMVFNGGGGNCRDSSV